ncbi:unnamed protein product [Caenorhabditis auriculariae]|uniref:Uncharacterized protein n=1 Tax=Caenorhabditis auriculariae TaxID=2777116 RepID=A0A8S1HE37_9PELO|nr:unnamed protein product [Caenorhabditis auriculariae]
MPRRRGAGGGGFGLASLRRELHLHNLFRDTPRRSATPTTSLTSASPQSLSVNTTFSHGGAAPSDGGHLAPSASGNVHARRESFLYRPSDDPREPTVRPVSRASSIASNEHGRWHSSLHFELLLAPALFFGRGWRYPYALCFRFCFQPQLSVSKAPPNE